MPLTKVAGLLQLIILILCSTFLGFTSDLVFRRNQEKEQQLAGGGEGGGLTSEDSRITWFLGLGFRFQGLGFTVWGFGFRVWGLRFRD